MLFSLQPRYFAISYRQGNLVEVEAGRVAFGLISIGRSAHYQAAVDEMHREAKALHGVMDMLEPEEDDESEQDDEA
jgi:hypothetical protein